MQAYPKKIEISRARITKGYSMRMLAKETGLTIGTISNIESKIKAVYPQNAMKICHALDKKLDDLFEVR